MLKQAYSNSQSQQKKCARNRAVFRVVQLKLRAAVCAHSRFGKGARAPEAPTLNPPLICTYIIKGGPIERLIVHNNCFYIYLVAQPRIVKTCIRSLKSIEKHYFLFQPCKLPHSHCRYNLLQTDNASIFMKYIEHFATLTWQHRNNGFYILIETVHKKHCC